MPELLGLVLQRLDQDRIGMAQRVHRDAGHAVEVGVPVGGVEARAFASLERQRGAAVDTHDVVGGNGGGGRLGHRRSPPKTEASPPRCDGDWKAWRSRLLPARSQRRGCHVLILYPVWNI